MVERVVHTAKQRDGEVTHVLTIVNQTSFSASSTASAIPASSSPTTASAASRRARSQPFEFDGRVVGYEPAEAASKIKGGNSNWRGPIWFPTCFLLIESLRKLGKAFGPNFQLRTPADARPDHHVPRHGAGLADRLIRIFTRDGTGGGRSTAATGSSRTIRTGAI